MKKYNKFEEFEELMNEDLHNIPKIITGKWLEQQLLDRNSRFRYLGFGFSDLTNHEFEDNIDFKTIRKIPFSTRTKFPEKHPFHFDRSIYHVGDDIRKLHEEGIDGSGMNIAIIDFYFETIPNELKESLFYLKKFTENSEVSFHGTTVACQLCGKNLGVAPKAKLWFYETGQGRNNIINDLIIALKDIYEKNKKGANIKVISISGSRHRENPEFQEVYQKLLNQGCYIIDSPLFGENFTSINVDANTGELYYTDRQEQAMGSEIATKIAIKTGGKMTPLVTTENDYLYCGQASYSWSIPILAGYFVLALQVSPDLTYDEFLDLARTTAKNENGIMVFNINGVIEEIKKEHMKTM